MSRTGIKPEDVVTELKACSICTKPRMIQSNRNKCNGCRQLAADIKKGRIRTPEYQHANVRKYKEPMEKVADGFGYYGAIVETDDQEHIQCHICGFFYANLGSHVSSHDIKIREYKIKFGLRIHTGLLSPKELERKQKTYNEKIRGTARGSKEFFKKMSAKGAKAIEEKGVKRGGDVWTMQTRNERGLCKDQTAAKIQALAETMDGVPTLKEFTRLYGSGQSYVINHWFGSWREALRELGYTHFETARFQTKVKRIEHAVTAIRMFYEQEGRTPQWYDFETVDYLPKGRAVQTLFGNLNNAREQAEVPVLVRAGGGKWVEAAR